MTSSPTVPRSGRPVASTTSAAVPGHGPLNDAGLIGVRRLQPTIPIGARVVRGAFVQDEPCAEQQRPGDRPRAHHPAQIGEPEEGVAATQIERVRQILGALDREAAVDVDRTLRPAGRTGGVDEHVGGLGVGRLVGVRRPCVRRWTAARITDDRRDRLVPPAIAIRVPGCRGRTLAEPPDHDDTADAWRQRDGLVGDCLHRHDAASSQEPIRGDQHRGFAVPKPSRNGRSRVPREDRREDRPQPAESQRRYDRLEKHRQEDPDPVSGPDALTGEHRRGRPHGLIQFRVCQPPDLTVFALPRDGLAVGVAGGAGFGRRSGVVERAAGPPARPFRPARGVHDGGRPVLPGELQVVGGGAPEPARVVDCTGMERGHVRHPGVPDEPGETAVGEMLRTGPPRDIGYVAAEDGSPVGRHRASLARARSRRLIRSRQRYEWRLRVAIRKGCGCAPWTTSSATCSDATGVIRTRQQCSRFAPGSKPLR